MELNFLRLSAENAIKFLPGVELFFNQITIIDNENMNIEKEDVEKAKLRNTFIKNNEEPR